MSSNQDRVDESVLITEAFTFFSSMCSGLQRGLYLSFLCCLLSCCSQEIPNLSPAGLCFLRKGKDFEVDTYIIYSFKADSILPT